MGVLHADFERAVFEDKALVDEAIMAIEKVVRHEDIDPVNFGPEEHRGWAC